MSKLTRRTVILAGSENVYGHSPETEAALGVMVNQGLSVTVSGERINRDPARSTLSPFGHLIGTRSVSLDLTVEAKGGGLSEGQLQTPEYDPLLLACGLVRTVLVGLPVADPDQFVTGETVANGSGVTATVRCASASVLYVTGVSGGVFAEADVIQAAEDEERTATLTAAPYPALEYRPTSDPAHMGSVTVWLHRDGILHVVPGCRGSLALDCAVGRIPSLRFTLTGLYADPEDATLPNPRLSEVRPPLCLGLGLRLGEYAPVASALQIALNNDLNNRTDVNSTDGVTEVMLTGRAPGGSIDPEAAALAEFDPWRTWRTAGTVALEARIGGEAGNRLTLLAPRVQYTEAKYGDRNGLVTYDLPFTCLGENDDELRLIWS